MQRRLLALVHRNLLLYHRGELCRRTVNSLWVNPVSPQQTSPLKQFACYTISKLGWKYSLIVNIYKRSQQTLFVVFSHILQRRLLALVHKHLSLLAITLVQTHIQTVAGIYHPNSVTPVICVFVIYHSNATRTLIWQREKTTSFSKTSVSIKKTYFLHMFAILPIFLYALKTMWWIAPCLR